MLTCMPARTQRTYVLIPGFRLQEPGGETTIVPISATLDALWHRERTGHGQRVDMSMVNGLVYILENALVRYTLAGQVPGPLGTRHPAITPFQALPTTDGWIVVAIGNDVLWQRLCEAIDVPSLATDPRFMTNALRTENYEALCPILEKAFGARNSAEWFSVMEAYQLPYSPIRTIDEIVDDPNLRYRGMIASVEQPGMGQIEIAGSPFHLSETPASVRSPALLLGEHTTQILCDVFEYDEQRVQSLLDARAVCDADLVQGSAQEDS